jgi:fluoroquinolone transport system ATP-binding protein
MIEVVDLRYAYTGTQQHAVRHISFQIAAGEVFGFLGPSGAGKTTTQKILIGLLREYEGHVSVMNRDLRDWKSDYYEKIGVSFEVPNHYLKLTAAENLTYFRSLYSVPTRDPHELLAMFGLGEDAGTLVAQFSKGMKNRLSVARALLNNPQLIFLDEPTNGLDPVNAQRVKSIVREQQKAGKTIFLTTHDMTVADQLCDRVAFIVDGAIKRIGSPRQLKLEHGKQTVRVEYGANGRLDHQDFPLTGLGANAAFLNLLNDQPVKTIHTQEATLEDVFIRITGRNLS